MTIHRIFFVARHLVAVRQWYFSFCLALRTIRPLFEAAAAAAERNRASFITNGLSYGVPPPPLVESSSFSDNRLFQMIFSVLLW